MMDTTSNPQSDFLTAIAKMFSGHPGLGEASRSYLKSTGPAEAEPTETDKAVAAMTPEQRTALLASLQKK